MFSIRNIQIQIICEFEKNVDLLPQIVSLL